jgi:polyisoprenoid-binding protein YceI
MGSLFRSFVSLSLLSASLAFAGWTQEGAGSATVDAKGTMGIKIHGHTEKVTVSDDGKTLTVTVGAADIETDNSLRNGHMREDIGAEKYKTLALSVPLESLKFSEEDGKTVEAEGTGDFAWHDKVVKVPFKYKATRSKGVYAVEATAKLNVEDFGIKIRSYLGVGVKPEVDIGAKFSVKK